MEKHNGELIMMVENITFAINTANNELENLKLLLKSVEFKFHLIFKSAKYPLVAKYFLS